MLSTHINDALNDAIEATTPFTKPTLFIRGGNSSYIQNNDAGDIQRLFPESTVVTIQGAGHWVHADKPEEFGRVVLDFLLKP